MPPASSSRRATGSTFGAGGRSPARRIRRGVESRTSGVARCSSSVVQCSSNSGLAFVRHPRRASWRRRAFPTRRGLRHSSGGVERELASHAAAGDRLGAVVPDEAVIGQVSDFLHPEEGAAAILDRVCGGVARAAGCPRRGHRARAAQGACPARGADSAGARRAGAGSRTLASARERGTPAGDCWNLTG